MSWDINHVVIVGRLTRDPELTYTQSGAAVCRFSVAVNRSSGPRVEGQDEAASYFNVVAWNKTAELCKYMENTFLATKVAFVNQFYDLAQVYGVNYNELRELWLADERIGRSHTIVTEERGYRGRCLPKDIAAIIQAAKPFGGAPLLEAIDRYNDEVCRRADETRRKVPPGVPGRNTRLPSQKGKRRR
jgi:hypothetical protein